jgi:hypothetical protein
MSTCCQLLLVVAKNSSIEGEYSKAMSGGDLIIATVLILHVNFLEMQP